MYPVNRVLSYPHTKTRNTNESEVTLLNLQLLALFIAIVLLIIGFVQMVLGYDSRPTFVIAFIFSITSMFLPSAASAFHGDAALTIQAVMNKSETSHTPYEKLTAETIPLAGDITRARVHTEANITTVTLLVNNDEICTAQFLATGVGMPPGTSTCPVP